MELAGLDQLGDHRRQSAGPEIFLAEIEARRLHVDEQRQVVADLLPIVAVELDADVLRDGIDVDRRVGRAADRRVRHDDVLERLAGHDVGRLQILPHHVDDALAGLVRHLSALAVGRRDRGRARQRHAERLGKRVHGRGGAHGVAVADGGRRAGDDVDELLVVDVAGGVALARLPDDGAGAEPLVLAPAVEHGSDIERDRRDVHGRCRHQAGRHGLVAAGQQHDAVEEVAVQQLDERQIGEVAVKARGRPFAGLLDRMRRELEADAAGRNDALAHALRELEVVAVAGREIGAGLGDADDRLARLQLLRREAEIEVALDIERGHSGIVGIVEPKARTKLIRRDPPRLSSHPCPPGSVFETRALLLQAAGTVDRSAGRNQPPSCPAGPRLKAWPVRGPAAAAAPVAHRPGMARILTAKAPKMPAKA